MQCALWLSASTFASHRRRGILQVLLYRLLQCLQGLLKAQPNGMARDLRKTTDECMQARNPGSQTHGRTHQVELHGATSCRSQTLPRQHP